MRTARHRRDPLADETGSAMIEFALILPVFLLIVFGLFDIGRIVFLKAQLENAVREGARLGMVAQPYSEADVRTRVTSQVGLADATVNAPCGCNYDETLTVNASLPVNIIVAGIVPGLPSPTIQASASVRIE